MIRNDGHHLATKKNTLEYFAELLPAEAQPAFLEAVQQLADGYEKEIIEREDEACRAVRYNCEHVALIDKIKNAENEALELAENFQMAQP